MTSLTLAIVTPAREDWLVIAGAFVALGVVAIVGGAAGRLLDWIDSRRAPTPLSRDQLADRGAPPWPWHDHTWADVYPADAEGEVVP